MNTRTYRNVVIGRVLAVLAAVSMILSTMSVSFLVAQASEEGISEVPFTLYAVPNPPGADADFEYVAISNSGDADVNFSGWKLVSGDAEIPLNGVSAGPSTILVCANSNFDENSGRSCRFEFPANFHLVNTGGTVSLVAPDGTVVVETSWGDVSDDETLVAVQNSGSVDIAREISICHRASKNDDFDPKTAISIDAFIGDAHYIHDDIIPSFFYQDEEYVTFYSGANWNNRTNQEIWTNDCAQPIHDAITVVKVVDDESGEDTDFEFNFNFNDDDDDEDFTLTGGAQFTFEDLEDTYQLISEYETPGWTLDNIVCESAYPDDEYRSDITSYLEYDDPEVEVDLDRGDHVICTFYNSKDHSPTGTIVVEKVITDEYFGDIALPFNFTSSWGDFFSLSDGETYTSNPLSILEGPYSVTEDPVREWEPSEAECVSDLDPERPISNEEISLQDGETVTCTFYNTRDTELQLIGGSKWDDANGDGVWDDDESVLSDWTIALRPINLSPVAEVYVPADGTVVTAPGVLDSQRTYVIEVEGTYQYKQQTEYRHADAEWSYRNDSYTDSPLQSHGWTAGEFTFPRPNDLDLLINGRNVDWGSFNGEHLYKRIMQGTGNTVDFSIEDSSYTDNVGGLNVAIYDVTPYVITTDEEGWYSFLVPPGEYQIIEESKDGWEQTYPEGPDYYHITTSSDVEIPYNFGNKLSEVTPMGSLTVIKRVIGGPLSPSDFSFDVWEDYIEQFTEDDQSQGTWVLRDESFNEDGHNTIMLPYGQYDVRELGRLENYGISYDGCTNIRVPAEGESDAVCIITNTYTLGDPEVDYGPYCGDGVRNQEWEQCEVGDDGCLIDTCQWEEQNQCVADLQLIKITLGASDSASFDDMLYLGSASSPIPNGVWFNFNESGDDSIQNIATQDNGLAISRDVEGGRLLLGFRGENDRHDFDFAIGKIETMGINLGSVDRNPIVSWPLESGVGGVYRDIFSVDTYDDVASFDMRADTGRDAVAVDINDGEPPLCSLPQETFTIDGYKWNDTNGNGQWDEEESGLSGWTIYAHNGDQTLETVTGDDGQYSFAVSEGSWTVTEEDREGWTQTYADECSYTFQNSSDLYSGKRYYIDEGEQTSPEAQRCDFGNQLEDDARSPVDPPSTVGTRFPQGSIGPVGQVLGASTTAEALCGIYLSDYMRAGDDNNPVEVYKLQAFLIGQGAGTVQMTGIFDEVTDQAVRAFQRKYTSDILTPWYEAGLAQGENPTGYVYKTTKWKINDIMCPGISPFPTLLEE